MRGSTWLISADFSSREARDFSRESIHDGTYNYEVIKTYENVPANGFSGYRTSADKTALENAITEAEALNSGDYTGESWAVLEKALKDAKDVVSTYNVSQYRVDSALAALENAMNALVRSGTSSGTPGSEHFTGFKLNEEDGHWYYYVNGEIASGRNDVIQGTVNGQDGWWRVVGGKVDFSCNSVEQNDYGWWYVLGGQVQFGYTGVADYANAYGWWYIRNGQVDFGKTGIEPNSYGRWRVVNGQVNFSCNSVEQNDFGWWYVVGGQVQFGYTGVANYANAYGWWYISGGKVDFNKTSVEPNNYGWWRVENGKVNFAFTGWAQNSYGTWYCVNGKVDFSRG